MIDKTHHGNCLTVSGVGILITGASGSGKSSLTMGLLETAKREGLCGQFVSDDRVILKRRGDKVFAYPPESLKGKIELRGYGIIEYPSVESTEVSLVVELTDDADIERMPEIQHREISGIQVPLVHVPKQHEQAALRIVFAWLADHVEPGISLALQANAVLKGQNTLKRKIGKQP
ncbi:MAG: HPr kinase/phosphatase C-terminal domain-containing protein [Pseudomonadota bacterium]